LSGLETRPFATTNKNVLGIFFFGDFFKSLPVLLRRRSRAQLIPVDVDSGIG
jgi:hypothetical protein